MQKPERNRRAHRRQSAPRFDVTASRLDALKPGQPARFSFVAGGREHKSEKQPPFETLSFQLESSEETGSPPAQPA